MKKIVPVLITVLAVIIAVAYFAMSSRAQDSLVVYCAHDSVFAADILAKFEKKTGIKIVPMYDTEATKSLGLVEMLKAEKKSPRCDVFWNNELLGIMELKKEGVLEAYKGEGYDRIPAKFKDPEGCWAGFASRLRVYIINTDKMKPDEKEIKNRFAAGDLSRVSIAKPLYGTTLTHYCCLWSEYGEVKLKRMHDDWIARKIMIVNGNAASKDAVSGGSCDFGWTDTDDYFEAKDDKKPVAVLPVRLDSGKTICIPNTVAVIKGTQKLEKAKKLVDYLLSEECEVVLANSKSRQIPLGPVDEKKIPEEVWELKKWADEGISLSELSDIYPKCIQWLKEKL